MIEKEQEISPIIEYFKSLRDEIHLRIQEHTRLVWIKIISLGTIISFLIGKFYETIIRSKPLPSASPLFYLVWTIPLTAIIFDMLIASNLRVINNLGHYIKKYIEWGAFTEIRNHLKIGNQINYGPTRIEKLIDFPMKPIDWMMDQLTTRPVKCKPESEPKFKFWEEAAGQAECKYHCYTLEDVFVVWLFTLASGFFSGLLRWQLKPNIWIDVPLAVICAMGIVLALIYLIRSIIMERKF